MMEFHQNIYSDRPLAISRDVCSESLISEFDQGLVHEYMVLLIQKHLLEMGREESLILSPSWGGGGIDGGTIRDGGAVSFKGCVCDMRSIDIRGSAGKGGEIPPELGGDVGKFEVFVIQGGAEDVIEVRLRFGMVRDSVI